jgi:hypothetical protein
MSGDAAKGVAMPKGPQGQRRPADVIGAAILVAKIATGELTETAKPKSGRTRSGIAGSRARNQNLTSEERRAIARKASAARWK